MENQIITTMSQARAEMIQKCMKMGHLLPEAKLVLLTLLLLDLQNQEVSIILLDKYMNCTVADVDVGSMYLRNTLDLPTMKKYGLNTAKINISSNPSTILLSKDWRIDNGSQTEVAGKEDRTPRESSPAKSSNKG
jgi:hypothetical protein